MSGQAAADSGDVLDFLDFPVINASGTGRFSAFVSTPEADFPFSRGIYRADAGLVTQVAREGNAVPGAAPNTVFSSIGTPLLNASGQIAFESGVAAADTGNGFAPTGGIFLDNAGALSQITPTFDSIAVVLGPFELGLNDSGEVAFRNSVPGNEFGLFRGSTSGLTAITPSNQPVAGLDPGLGLGFVPDAPTISPTGRVGFRAFLTGPGLDISNNEALVVDNAGALTLIAREGEQAPDTEPGVVFGDFSSSGAPALNAAGQAAFLAELSGQGVDSSNDEGIYLSDSAGLNQVVRQGSQVPGADAGVVFGGFSNPILNSSGQIAFSAGLMGPGTNGPNDNVVYIDNAGVLTEVVRVGDEAPGDESGVAFDNILLQALNGSGRSRLPPT